MPSLGSVRAAVDRLLARPGGAGIVPLVLVSALIGAASAAAVLWSQQRLEIRADPVAALPRAVRVTTTQPPAAPLVVHVAGAVLRPGLVEVPDGSRGADALAAAGASRAEADLTRLNLAERLTDGARLYVPAQGEVAPPPVLVVGSGASGTGGAGSAPGPIDVNTATEQQLDGLPGVGPATAAAIVAYRQVKGRFTSVEGLAEVRGIGPAKLEALRPLIRV